MRLLDTAAGGQIPDDVLRQQIVVLNQGFSDTGLEWRIVGIDRTTNPDWYRQAVGRYALVPQIPRLPS
jgi:hypothetical protein